MRAGSSIDALAADLTIRFGTLIHTGTKPLAVHYRNADDTILIKVYRGIDPLDRQAREIAALTSAAELGIAVPSTVDWGREHDLTWLAVPHLPGAPLMR
jgi:aminoglycoside phosphotransferase